MGNTISKAVGPPSVGGIKDAAIDFGLGAGGGLVYAVSTAVTGSGLLGGLVGAALAGSILKGPRGTVVATMLGFMTILGGLGAPAAASSQDPGVM